MEEFIKSYDSQSKEYQIALDIYIRHSDEKEKIQQWLGKCVEKLVSRSFFIDAGAAKGGTTAFLSGFFEQALAIEPSSYFRTELRKKCPGIQILPDKISDASIPDSSADMILCSHVFYHIPQEEWMETLEKLASWLVPDGILVLILSHYKSDFLKLYEYFYQGRFDLDRLGETFRTKHSKCYEVRMENIPSFFKVNDFDSAYAVAEWFLNDNYGMNVPRRCDVENYVRRKFSDGEGGFYISCDQSFLRIRRRRPHAERAER